MPLEFFERWNDKHATTQCFYLLLWNGIRVIVAYDVHLYLGLIYMAEVLHDKILLTARQDRATYNCYFNHNCFLIFLYARMALSKYSLEAFLN